MKTSKDLTFAGKLHPAKLLLFLMTILVLAACTAEEITPVPKDSQPNRMESTLDNTTVEALRRPRVTSIEVFCDWLKARANRLLDEYKDPSLSDKRRTEILTELREIGSAWKVGGCQTIYGDIVKTFPRQPLNPSKAAPIGGTVLK